AALQPATTLVLKEQDPPRPTHILIRGNHTRKGDPVQPGTPAVLPLLRKDEGRRRKDETIRFASFILHPSSFILPPSSLSADRLDLARWLVDRDNPLVGRVIMNRLWAQYFGRGFVETSEDFGAQGEPPSH